MDLDPALRGNAKAMPRSLPLEWAAVSAEIMERIVDPALPELLVKALRTLISFSSAYQHVYATNSPPITIYQPCSHETPDEGLANFVTSTYAINPFYRCYRSGLGTGVYRLQDLARRDVSRADIGNHKAKQMPSEEIGYLTLGWPAGQHEVCIALEMSPRQCVGISLARDDGEFSTADIYLVEAVVPFLAASVRHYFASRQANSVHRPGLDIKRVPRKDNLSPRERMIMRLLLQGHSTLSISLQLEISTTTVKTHRKNLYAKLGIATQFELFSLFTPADFG